MELYEDCSSCNYKHEELPWLASAYNSLLHSQGITIAGWGTKILQAAQNGQNNDNNNNSQL